MKSVILIVLLFITIFPYTLSIVVDPMEGVATIDDGMVSYTHPNLVRGSFVYDSFFIELEDANGMMDTARYTIIVIPKETIDYHIIDNPLIIHNNTPAPINYDVLDYLNISAYKYNYGSAIIIRTRLSLTLNDCSGIINIFDAVGNRVVSDMDMDWVTASDGKNVGVGVWDGRNLNGRVVGSGAYLVIINATLRYEIFTENGPVLETKHVSYRMMIGVKYGGK